MPSLRNWPEIDRLDARSLKRDDVSVERLEESMRSDGHSKKSAVSGIVSGMIMIEDSLAWESIALLPWLATDDTPCWGTLGNNREPPPLGPPLKPYEQWVFDSYLYHFFGGLDCVFYIVGIQVALPRMLLPWPVTPVTCFFAFTC